MAEPIPAGGGGRRSRLGQQLLAVLGALCLCGLLGAVILEGWFGSDQVRSSTGAWILAHLHWARLAEDYRSAAAVSLVPNTTYNPLYPALVLALGQLSAATTADLVPVAHRVSAAGIGLTLVPLALLWRRIGGLAVGLVGAAAILFPPFVATGAFVRYDTLAIALALGAVAAGASAADRGAPSWRWGLAGLLSGLAYLAREFTVGPALGGVGVAWLVGLARTRKAGAALGSLLLVALGLLLGAVPLPLLLGLSPLGGVDALVGYGGREQHGPPRAITELVYLDWLARPFAVAAVGWVLAVWRARDRGAVLVGFGALLPFGAFLLSSQQSPQYYLLGHVLLLSGLAGYATLLGRLWPLQLVLAAGLWVVGARWTADLAPQLLHPDLSRPAGLHTEGWPAGPSEPRTIVAEAVDWVGDRPLLVCSGRMENVDALVPIFHDRPAAFVFDNWLDRVPEIVSLYDGEPVYYLAIEGHPRFAPPRGLTLPEGAVVVQRWETRDLVAALALLPGRPATPDDACRHGGPVRGACMQKAWLEVGDAGLPDWIRGRGARFRQRLTAVTRWW